MGCSMALAARAVATTSSTGSLYVVMKTSTVAPGGGGGAGPRGLRRQTVTPNRNESMRLYVSARTSGTAIHQAAQLMDDVHRHVA